MPSLAVPIVIMLAISLMAGWSVARGTRGLSRARARICALGLAAAFIGFIMGLRGRPEWLNVLPFADAVIYADWTPLLGAAFTGLAWTQIPGSRLRKLITLVPLALLMLWLSYGNLLRPTPVCVDDWTDGVCQQTSESSCSAACAATVLRFYGLPATELELAKLCLTCNPRGRESGGTTWHGLYRGMKIKTAGTGLTVDVQQCTIDDLLQEGSGPWIISVGIDEGTTADPIYREQYGWRPGLRHSVVLFKQVSADRVEMGDPSVGREQWSLDDLRVLWRGDALRLRKDGSVLLRK